MLFRSWRVSEAMCVPLCLLAFIILHLLADVVSSAASLVSAVSSSSPAVPSTRNLTYISFLLPVREPPEDGIKLFDCMTTVPRRFIPGSYSPFNLQPNEGSRLVASSVRCTFAQRQLDRNRVPSTTMSLAHCLSASFIRSPLQGQLSLRSHSKTSFGILPLHLAISHLAGRRPPLLADVLYAQRR